MPLPHSKRHTVTLAKTISVSFDLTVPDTSAMFSTVVMRIKKGKSVFFSLILDHCQGGWKALSIVADDAAYVARFETSLNQQRQGTVKTLIRSSDDSFTVELADTVLSFRGIGFLEGMKHSITVFRK